MDQQPTSSPRNATHGSASARPRLYYIYYLLALFDVITVSLGLVLIDRITSIYTDSVNVNQVWANRLAEFSELRELAADVNAPGNDVFETGDVAQEAANLESMLDAFGEKAKALRADVSDLSEFGATETMLATFDDIDDATTAMVGEARRIFDAFDAEDFDQAGRHMAAMDRAHVRLNSMIGELESRVRSLQSANLQSQADDATALRRYEFVIAGLIVMMVGGVTIYGTWLAGQMKREAREKDHYIQALTESEAGQRAILASALDPIITIDAFGIVQSASDSVERVFGWRPNEIVGQNITSIMPEPHRSEHDNYLAAFRDTGNTTILGRTREFKAVHRDGSLIPIELSVSQVERSSTAPQLFTGIIRDVTETKEAQYELEKHRSQLEELVVERTAALRETHEQLRLADRLAAIGTLAAGLGHDMNNVLFPIRCRLDAVDQSEIPDDLREHFDAMRKSSEYLQQLADGLHLLALDPDDQDASTELTTLGEWWSQVGPLLARGLPKHVTFTTELADYLPRITVAPHRLTQAVLNLIVNAGEAIGNEAGEVHFGVKFDEPTETVRLAVRDTGHGMPAEVKRRALDPFYTTKKRGLGTGLGLSLVSGVVQGAGGRVEIESEPQRGTTVVLTFPTIPETTAPAAADVSPTMIALSIEDARTAAFVRSMLQAAGLNTIASNTPDAQQCAAWFCDSGQRSLETARRFHASHRIVVIGNGSGSEAWRELDVIIIEDPSDIENLRQAISQINGSIS